jgi:hypothetical protein
MYLILQALEAQENTLEAIDVSGTWLAGSFEFPESNRPVRAYKEDQSLGYIGHLVQNLSLLQKH